ncbi:MAG TPA: hypothetical protein VE987_03535 [Polyangiaceae bacterium]|nr:hypothetical protein [Polyangiaceae bacterium]
MSIVGDRPETGVRVVVERPAGGGPPWRYEGEAVTAGGRFPLAATIDAQGQVTVAVQPGAPDGLAAKARLILRAAYKHAADDASPPPRRLARWRSDG